jgi:uncharacterized protein (DUF58 family)
MVREFEQPSTAPIVAIADRSLSMQCGINGVPIAAAVARAIAILGMSASFFQDPFGLVTFDAGFEHLAAIRPRRGKGHVVHCVDAYQHDEQLQMIKRAGSVGRTLAGYLRDKSMLPVISDFLFDDAETILGELSFLNTTHDVFLVLIDSAFAFELPAVSAGWIEMEDVETGSAPGRIEWKRRREISTSTSSESGWIRRSRTSRWTCSSPNADSGRRTTKHQL